MNHTKPKNKKNLETELTSIALYDFRNAKREREKDRDFKFKGILVY